VKVMSITCSERGDRPAKTYEANLVDKEFLCIGCGLPVPAAGNDRHEVRKP
jgi:hypothetical protein